MPKTSAMKNGWMAATPATGLSRQTHTSRREDRELAPAHCAPRVFLFLFLLLAAGGTTAIGLPALSQCRGKHRWGPQAGRAGRGTPRGLSTTSDTHGEHRLLLTA